MFAAEHCVAPVRVWELQVTLDFRLHSYAFSFQTGLVLGFAIEALINNAGRLFIRFTPEESQYSRLRAASEK
jgi:hypothetical protein